jgi:predicted nucleotidyltransferase
MDNATLKLPEQADIEEIKTIFKSFSFIHSLLLFGSRAKGKIGRDTDICIIPARELTMNERLSIDSAMPEGVDISIFSELPVHIRKRVFEEGEVLYTKDMYHLLEVGKETDLEYSGYKIFRENYNKTIRERGRKIAGIRRVNSGY